MGSSIELLTVAEVAEELRISRTSVYRLLQGGEMPHMRAGVRRYLVTREQLDAYIVASSIDPNEIEARVADLRAARRRSTGEEANASAVGL